MELIRTYDDQESQGSSSGDERKFQRKYALPNRPVVNKPLPRTNFENFRVQRFAFDRLMPIFKQQQQQQQQANRPKYYGTNFSLWLNDVDKEIHTCLGSISVLQKHTILESMDYFISKLTRDYDKLIQPKIADILSNYIRTYLYIYKYFYRSYDMGKRYFKRITKILAIYTDLELCASIRGTEYDKSIAERIQMMYQTYLDHSDNSMVLDVLLNTKRLWRRHRGILILLFEYFLVRKTPIELADNLFIKNLIMFKKWLYIEEVGEDRNKIRDAFIKFVKPKKTICMNSLFKPYLPVDAEGFVTIDNMADILDRDYSLGLLTRCLKKAEERSDSRSKEVIIVLTDDENDANDENDEDDDYDAECLSNRASSATQSHHDDISNDFDWYSTNSAQGTHLSQGFHATDTLSVDTLPPFQKSPSSVDSNAIDIALQTMMTAHQNDVNAYIDRQSALNNSLNVVGKDFVELDGVSNPNLSSLNESIFNRLLIDINSTQISIPSAMPYIVIPPLTNGESSQLIENNDHNLVQADLHLHSENTGKLPIETSEQSTNNTELAKESSKLAAFGDRSDEKISEDNSNAVTKESSAFANQIGMKQPEQTQLFKNCDKTMIAISNCSAFKNHQETLNNLDEILSTDLEISEKAPVDNVNAIEGTSTCNNNGNKNQNDTRAIAINSNNSIAQSNSANNSGGLHLNHTVSLNSLLDETSLLTKSAQEMLFIDKDTSELLSDTLLPWNKGTTNNINPKSNSNGSSSSTSDSPIMSMRKGTDRHCQPKTYSRTLNSDQKAVEMKSISTQTSISQTTIKPISLTYKITDERIIDEDGEESFLNDIFGSTNVRSRLTNSATKQYPGDYYSSTPKPSTSYSGFKASILLPQQQLNSALRIDEVESPTEATPKTRRKRQTKKKEPPVQMKMPKESKPKSRKTTPNVKKPKKTTDEDVKGKTKRNQKKPSTVKTTKKASPSSKSGKPNRIKKQTGSVDLIPPNPATILHRQDYAKLSNSQSDRGDNSLNFVDRSLRTYQRRSNGQQSNIDSSKQTPCTILERKTYIKSNTTTSFISPVPTIMSTPQTVHTSQTVQQVTKRQAEHAPLTNGTASKKVCTKKRKIRRSASVVSSNDSGEFVNKCATSKWDSTKGIRNAIVGAHVALHSSQETDATMSPAKMERNISTECSDMTNEIIADLEFSVEDGDDSTRKSKRRRKRPKILDL